MTDALFAECGTENKRCGDLWHAVLFYTAGVETRRALPPAAQASFIPYAYRYGLSAGAGKRPAGLSRWEGRFRFGNTLHGRSPLTRRLLEPQAGGCYSASTSIQSGLPTA